jgi:hypothetical protein
VATDVKNNSIALVAGVAAVALVIGVFGADTIKGWFQRKDPVQASLQEVHQLNRIEVLMARLCVAPTTPTDSTLAGIPVPGTRKISIIKGCGDVFYTIELSRLTEKDFRFDPLKKTLKVTLPQPRISKPNIDIRQLEEYTDGTILTFDQMSELGRTTNRNKVYEEMETAAAAKDMVDQARKSARYAIGNFLMLAIRNAGLADAVVQVDFVNETASNPR